MKAHCRLRVGLCVGALAGLAGAVSTVACSSAELTLPAPLSPAPTPPVQDGQSRTNSLRAGFGRADITPPPGLGLSDYGPAGGTAAGHRHRLYARAIVLEDRTGERIAFVTVDLAQPSFLLHRQVADRVATETGIGADRLALAATHTHAGPGHFFASKSYNEYAPGIRGFDPAVVEFLADQIAAAIRDAVNGLTPAAAAWVQVPVWGATWNRSLEAHRRNPPVEGRPSPPPGLSPVQQAIDPTWTMLRVDTISSSGDTVPAGALSVFAFHPTGNPPANDLYDGDVSALVERGLERHIDALAGSSPLFAPAAVHLLANGADGDVMLTGTAEIVCTRPAQRRGVRPGGPRTPTPLDEWKSDAQQVGSACVSVARALVNAAGDSLAARAIEIFERAGRELRTDLEISRTFRTVRLAGPDGPDGLCPEPRIGAGAAAGAEGSQSNFKDWRVLGLFPLNTEEGAVDPDGKGCHAPKRDLPWILRLGLGNLYLPTATQLMVVRVGDMVLALVPVEPTTEVGFRIREAILDAVTSNRLPARSAAVVGLANGYMQYTATREEYQAQHYEGGSTLYGPGFAEFLQGEIVDMVGELPGGGHASVAPMFGKPGLRRSLFPRARGNRPDSLVVKSTKCRSDTVIIRWLDAAPGDLLPSDGPMLSLHRSRTGDQSISVWDDDRFVEVRQIAGEGRRGGLWEARWTPPGGARGDYSVTFLRWPNPKNTRGFRCP